MAPSSSTSLLSRALIVFGITFLALPVLNRVWPSGWAWQPEQLTYLHMIWSIYATLGVFLILAAKNPAHHLSLIWFTVWSSLAHGTVMAIHSFTDPGQMAHLWGDVGGLYFTAIVLTVLTRPLSRELAPA